MSGIIQPNLIKLMLLNKRNPSLRNIQKNICKLQFNYGQLCNLFSVAFLLTSDNNIPLIFAIGIAVGLAKNHDGAAALAGGISYFIVGVVAQDVNYCLQLGTIYAQGVKYSELVNAGPRGCQTVGQG